MRGLQGPLLLSVTHHLRTRYICRAQNFHLPVVQLLLPRTLHTTARCETQALGVTPLDAARQKQTSFRSFASTAAAISIATTAIAYTSADLEAPGSKLVLRWPVAQCEEAARPDATGQPSGDEEVKAAGDVIQDPFVYPELTAGIEQRAHAQYLLLGYMERARREVKKIYDTLEAGGGMENMSAKLRFTRDMQAFEIQVDKDTQLILYGVKRPGARNAYLDRYGCTKWTPEALETLKAYGPIIEIGAGKGHWQKAATEAGADVLAFDDGSSVPRAHHTAELVGKVKKGNENMIQKHRERTLFLCYPEGEMADKALKEYRGEYFVYVGEGIGGVNATPSFFQTLESDWDCIKIVKLKPFPQNFEKMFVMRRKGGPLPPRGWFSWFRRR